MPLVVKTDLEMVTPNMMRLVPVFLACACLCQAGHTQTMEDVISGKFEVPIRSVDANDSESMISSTRDSSLNKVVTTSPGWGYSASSIGNLVNVVAQGNNNTVVINASQINSGSQQAIMATPLRGAGSGVQGNAGVQTGLAPTASFHLSQ